LALIINKCSNRESEKNLGSGPKQKCIAKEVSVCTPNQNESRKLKNISYLFLYYLPQNENEYHKIFLSSTICKFLPTAFKH